MAKSMNVPILGIVENYSYLVCPDCGKKISVFGESHIEEIASKMDLKVLGKMRSIRPWQNFLIKVILQKQKTNI